MHKLIFASLSSGATEVARAWSFDSFFVWFLKFSKAFQILQKLFGFLEAFRVFHELSSFKGLFYFIRAFQVSESFTGLPRVSQFSISFQVFEEFSNIK